MRKNILMLCAIFMSIFLLVACGTAEDQNDEFAPDHQTANKNEDEQKDDTNKNDENEIEKETNEITKDEENQPASKETNTITYVSKEQEITKDTTLIDEETYQMRIAEGFDFTNEEPGKDLIFYKENDQISMRIEVFSTNDSTYDQVVSNTEEYMAAVNEQFKSVDIQNYIKENKKIEKAVAYQAMYENEEVLGIVLEKENVIVRLTIFDQEDYDLKDALIKMGLTIEGK